MKKTARYLFTIVITLSVVCSIAADDQDMNCNNPFTAMFSKSKNENIQKMILTTPQTGEFTICSNEWGANGTCCKPDKVQEVVQVEIDKWATQIKNFVKKVDMFEKLVSKRIWQLKKRVTDIKAWLENHSSQAYASQDAIIRAKYYAKHFGEVLSLFEKANYKEIKARFAKEIKVCFEKVKNFRLNAICYACSGSSSRYISYNKKLQVDSDTSNEITKDCIGSWNYVYSFMQSAKSIVLLNKIRKSEGNKAKAGAKKLEVQEEVGIDSTKDADEIAAYLNGFSQIAPEDILSSSMGGYFVEELLVFEGYNDDIAGDESIVEEAIKELIKEEQDEKNMSTIEKEELSKKIEKLKEDSKKQKVEMKSKVFAKTIPRLKNGLEQSKSASKEAEAKISQVQLKIKEAKNNQTMSDSDKDNFIVTQFELIKYEISKVTQAHMMVTNIAGQFYSFCRTDECQEYKKTLSEYFKQYSRNKKNIQDLFKDQVLEFNKQYSELLKTKFAAFVNIYKEAKELYSKIMAAENKSQPSRLLTSTTQTKVEAGESELQNMKAKFREISNNISIEMTKFQKWNSKWWAKHGKYYIQDPLCLKSSKKIYKRMMNMLTFVTAKEQKFKSSQTSSRILDTVTEAKPSINVTNGSKSVSMPQPIDKIPMVTTSSPVVIFTNTGTSYGLIIQAIFTLFAWAFWFM